MSIENPPAFPEVPADCNAYEGREGMTLRDHFAGQWLTTFRVSDPNGMTGADIAARCYAMADAMLAERIIVRS